TAAVLARIRASTAAVSAAANDEWMTRRIIRGRTTGRTRREPSEPNAPFVSEMTDAPCERLAARPPEAPPTRPRDLHSRRDRRRPTVTPQERNPMNPAEAQARLQGCYITIPTMFHDDADLSVDHDAIRRHVRFLIDGGATTGNAVLLAGGAAGDFSTMTFDERVAVWQAAVDAAAGRVPIAVGGPTTSTPELVRLRRAAQSVGADYGQVSPPFYHSSTEGDFLEHILAGADAADIGFIVYNTYWTSLGLSSGLVEKLVDVPNVVSLKWATPD